MTTGAILSVWAMESIRPGRCGRTRQRLACAVGLFWIKLGADSVDRLDMDNLKLRLTRAVAFDLRLDELPAHDPELVAFLDRLLADLKENYGHYDPPDRGFDGLYA